MTATQKPLATSTPWTSCDISRSQWFKMASAGKTPAPTARLGIRKPVWIIDDLLEWLRQGCPDRETFERNMAEGN